MIEMRKKIVVSMVMTAERRTSRGERQERKEIGLPRYLVAPSISKSNYCTDWKTSTFAEEGATHYPQYNTLQNKERTKYCPNQHRAKKKSWSVGSRVEGGGWRLEEVNIRSV